MWINIGTESVKDMVKDNNNLNANYSYGTYPYIVNLPMM